VPRVVSFIVLLAIVLLVGAVFFQVMAQFLVPLFLACVLLVIFQPLHARMQGRLPKHPRIAALLTTTLILLIVLVPSLYLGWKSYEECRGVYQMLSADVANGQSGRSHELASRMSTGADHLLKQYELWTGKKLDVEQLIKDASSMLGSAVLGAVGATLRLLFGLAIMMIALYYFLADGPGMVRALMQLSPLDENYETELLEKFGSISRSVVLATLLSAVAQGLVAGVGYWFALPSAAPVFLLIALTMVMSIVPFIGGAGVWVPTCLGLLVLGGDTPGSAWPAAVGLALYCAIFVSLVDNVIKPYVLHGEANLHPLLALLSILGGVHVLGAVGILVGPMLVSFLQALLNMLHKELENFGKSPMLARQLAGAPAATPAVAKPAEAAKAGDKPAVDKLAPASKDKPPASHSS
jgi:predicted PurR-regulated permease PerM